MTGGGMSIVDWERQEIRRRSKGERRESYVPVKCLGCGRERWLTVANARKAEKEARVCRSCTGKKGYKVTVEKLGRRGMLELFAAKQLEKPSKPEVIVAELLDELLSGKPLHYTRQEIFNNWCLLDFALYRGDTLIGLIEVNGYWHKRTRQDRDNILLDMAQAKRIAVLFVDGDICVKEADRPHLARILGDFILSVGVASNGR